MTPQKKITVRVSDTTEKFLSEKFDNPSAGGCACIEIVERTAKSGIEPFSIPDSIEFLSYIRSYSLRELRGKLTAAEWSYLADALNGTMITPEFRCNVGGLIASIEDSNDFYGLGEKWSVDVPAFVEKVKQLTGAQVDAIYSRIEEFWNSENKDLEIWSKQV